MFDIGRAKTLLEYHKETGIFIRLTNHSSRARKGDIAGYLDKSHGYRYISIDGVSYYEHRLAWAFMTGEMPIEEIEHKNRIRNDNRWENLRLATHAENAMNRCICSSNKSGIKGVTWNVRAGKWMAQIAKNKVHYYLGLFEDVDSAGKAYREASKRLHTEFSSPKG